MQGWLKQDLDLLIKKLQNDLDLIASKDKDDEWKRDHYRYTFTVGVQRIYDLLNTQITSDTPASIKDSTKGEIQVLIDQLQKIID